MVTSCQEDVVEQVKIFVTEGSTRNTAVTTEAAINEWLKSSPQNEIVRVVQSSADHMTCISIFYITRQK